MRRPQPTRDERLALAVRDYLATCERNRELISPKYHPTEQGALKLIWHTPGEVSRICALYRAEKNAR